MVLLVVGRVSQNVARLALADAYRGRQLSLLDDRHRLRVLVLPLVHGAAPGVHEEVPDRRRFQAQLPRDCHLHLLRRPLGLLRGRGNKEREFYYLFHIYIELFSLSLFSPRRDKNLIEGFFAGLQLYKINYQIMDLCMAISLCENSY